MSLSSFIRTVRFAPENVTLPELITLGAIDRDWGGQRPAHLTWTEERLWARGLLQKFRAQYRREPPFFWFEITSAGHAMLERKRNEWRKRKER